MKKIFLPFLTLILFLSFAAKAEEHFGYLQSGEGACELKIQRQENKLYELIYTTNDSRLRAFDLKFNKGKFESFTHYFEKHGDRYHQLIKPMPIFPRTYLITVKNRGKGKIQISRTNLVFGDPTITKTDTCLLIN